MNSAWEHLNRTWKERLEKLEEAMQNAVQYQDNLQVRPEGLKGAGGQHLSGQEGNSENSPFGPLGLRRFPGNVTGGGGRIWRSKVGNRCRDLDY